MYDVWKKTSGEYDPKDDKPIVDPRGNVHTQNETKFKYWAMEQYGMTAEEYRGHTLDGTLKTLGEIDMAKDKVMIALALPSMIKNAAKTVKDVANGVPFDTSIALKAGDEAAEETTRNVSNNNGALVKEGLGKISGKEYTVTQKGVDNVRKYLTEKEFIEAYENQEMLKRLEDALAKGQKITGADAVYYTHELKEAQLVASGLDQEAAHLATLEYYGVSPFSVYHPDVIKKEPGWWNNGWFDFWNIKR